VGRIIIKIANKTLRHLMIERRNRIVKLDSRRTHTIGKLVTNLIKYIVNFVSIMWVLSTMNVDLAPLLAGAGVLGLAIGFGAQNLVKDVISGFFIIFEDQFAVGDVIQIKSFKGTVEEIGLRITRVKSMTGEVFIIPNGSIQEVTNYSIYNAIAIVDITVNSIQNTTRVLQLLKVTMHDLYETNEELIKLPEVLGIESLSQAEVVVRINAECKANTQGSVTRVIKEAVKKALDVHKLELEEPLIES